MIPRKLVTYSTHHFIAIPMTMVRRNVDPLEMTKQLEAYTLKRPQEVLLVFSKNGDTEDQIIIFKGFSSSLMHPTDSNPDNPILPNTAVIQSIDRLQSPYNPSNPIFIEQNISLEQMHQYLAEVGLT